VSAAPPSLRVYTLAKRLPGLWSGTDVLDLDGQLLAELEVYAAEEARVSNEEAQRAQAETRRAGGSRVAGRRGRRR
jgi:sRNA-binding protein